MKRILLLLGAVVFWVGAQGQLTAPFTESFDNTSIPTGWTNTSSSTSTNANWKFSGTPGNPSMSGSAYNPPVILDHTGNSGSIAWSDGSTPAVADCGLLTDSIDPSSLTSLFLEFWIYSNNVTNAGDNNTIYVNFYDGTQWNDSIWGYAGDGVNWQYVGIDLSTFTTSGNILFEFVVDQTTAGTAFYNDILLDDISVKNVPPCPLPLNFDASNITATTADVSWTAVSAASSYEVISGVEGFDPATAGTSQTTTTTSATVTGLSGATTYDMYLIADCGSANGISDTAGPVKVTTLCVPFTATYSNNFDSETDGQVAQCWEQYNSYNSFAYARVENLGTPRSGTQQLALYNYFNFSANDTLIGISPEFSDLTGGDKQIRFHVKPSIDNLRLFVLTLDGSTSSANGTFIDTIDLPTANVYQEVILPLTTANGYNGTDTYVGFAFDLSNTSNTFDYIYIDDFFYEVIPTCPKVSNPFLAGITPNSATIGFTGPGTAWQYEFGPAGFTQGTNAAGLVSATSNPFTITGLPGNTEHDVYIRNDCGGGDTSVWEGPFTFRTLCNPFTAPYYNGFENDPLDLNPLCWSSIVTEQFSFVEVEDFTFTAAPFAGSQALYIYARNSTLAADTVLSITPSFSDLTAGDKRIRFQANSDDPATELLIATTSSPLGDSAFNYIDTINFPTPDTYQEVIVNFNAANGYNGTDTYIVLQHNYGGTFDYIRIDEFNYELAPACTPPVSSSLGAFDITDVSASLFWDAGSQGIKTYVEVGSQGFTPGTGLATVLDSVAGTVDTLAVSGLTSQTVYEFYVQDSCATEGLSPWVGPFTFTTRCGLTSPLTLPLNDGFENYTAGSFTSVQDFCNLSYSWSFESDFPAGGRLRSNAGTAFYKNGTQAFTMDHSPSPTAVSNNYLIFTADLSSYTASNGIVIGFSYMTHAMEANPANRVWARGATTDPWVEIYDLDATNTGSGTYFDVSGIDIVAPLTAAGQSVGSRTQVRFGQAGRFSAFNTNFSDGMTIDDFSMADVPCPNPGAFNVRDLEATASTLGWAGNGQGYEVWFGTQGFYQGTATTTGVQASVNSDSLYVDTLLPNTCYEYVVRAYCGGTDTSDWAGPFVFCTPCSPFTATYTDNFDAPGQTVNTPPDCWSEVQIGGTADFGAVDIYTFGSPRSAPNHLRFYNYNNDTTMAISPNFSDLDAGDKRVSFYARNSSTFNTAFIWVGTVPSPGAYNQFDPIEKIVLTNVDQRIIVNFTSVTGYNGTDEHVAILHGDSSTFQTIYIDDFVYEQIPTCPEVASVNISNIVGTSADVNWTDVSSGASSLGFEIEYGTNPLGSSSNTTITAASGASSATMTNLLNATQYCVWVREICAVGDTSAWSVQQCFYSDCVPFYTAGYFNDFTNDPTFLAPLCFTGVQDVANTGSNLYTQNSTIAYSSPNHVWMSNGSNTASSDTLMLISPRFNDMNTGVDKRVSFFSYVSFGAEEVYVGTVSDPSNYGNFDPVDTITLTNTYAYYEVDLTTANGYNGTDQYVGIMHGMSSTFRNVYIDDFAYDSIPNCDPTKIFNISVNSTTQDSAFVSFTASGASIAQFGEIGAVGFIPGTGTALSSGTGVSGNMDFGGLAASGTYDLYFQDSCANGFKGPWVGPITVQTQCAIPSPVALPFFDGFESFSGTYNEAASFCNTDRNWRFSSDQPEGRLRFNAGSGFYSSGSAAATMDRDPSGAVAINYLILTVNLSNQSNLTTLPLYFDYMHHGEESSPNDRVWIRGSQTDSWVEIYDLYANSGAPSNQGNVINVGPLDIIAELNTANQSLSSTTEIRFGQEDNFPATSPTASDGFSIDNVQIGDISCPAPVVSSQALTQSSAQVSWDTTGYGSGATYLLEYGAFGFTPGTGTTVTLVGTNANTTITGLANNICQDGYLRVVCTGGDTSLATPFNICPEAIPCDNFDQYALGDVDDGESALIVPWPGGAGDAEYSNTRSQSASNSLRITDKGSAGAADVVAYFDSITTGIWDVSFSMYVETGDGAYFNIQENHDRSGTNNLWMGDIYFDANGTATVQYSATPVTVGTFTYSQGQWIDINCVIDVDNDTVYVEYNGSSTGLGWNPTTVNSSAAAQFNGVNFYSGVIASGSYDIDFYVDDFCVQPHVVTGGCTLPTAVSSANIDCDNFDLNWTSSTGGSVVEYGAQGFTPGTGTFSGIVTAGTLNIGSLTPGTTYDVYVADTCANDTSMYVGPLSVTSAVGPLPVADFIITGINNFTVSVDASASTGSNITYAWDFGDGNTGTGVTASNVYATGGSFNITLTVSNACGSSDTTLTVNSVSLFENALSQSLSLYPNPADDRVSIAFSSISNDAQIRLLDISGREVMLKNVSTDAGEYSGQIDVEKLAKGVYTVEIKSGDLTAMRKLIKQ